MQKILRTVALALVLSASGFAASFSFSGTVTSVQEPFSAMAPVGTSVTGTVNLISISEDSDESAARGFYTASVGSLSIVIGNSNYLFVADPDEETTIQVETYWEETAQSFTVGGNNLFLSGLVTFEGIGDNDGSFLGSDAFPSDVNWSKLTSSYGVIESNVVATAELPNANFGQVVFSVDEVNAVPEPGTVFGVAAGGLVLWMKRRQSR